VCAEVFSRSQAVTYAGKVVILGNSAR